jgi:peroxiredoxin
MAIRLGDNAPDFTAETTEGPISFHKWKGNSWAILFSHPKDFTPVCTTELGYLAGLKREFEKRNTKVIGLSVDPVDSHAGWVKDIKKVTGNALNFPLIADHDRKVSDLYGLRPVRHDPPQRRRHHDRALGVRRGARQQGEAHTHLPGQHGTQLRRVAADTRLAPTHSGACGIGTGVTDEEANKRFPGYEARLPYLRVTPQPKN